MLFYDRRQAGEKLAEQLLKYKDQKDSVVVGLPRGGVVTAAVIAERLNLPLDVTCPRKIGAPSNPEFAIGAVTETGAALLDQDAILMLAIPKDYIDKAILQETAKAQQRLHEFRKGMSPRVFKDKTVILVDDGLATGATMKAAIVSTQQEHAKRIIVAVPVSPPDTYQEIRDLVDEIVCVSTPLNFRAVGQFYEVFDQTEDEEVLALLNKGGGK